MNLLTWVKLGYVVFFLALSGTAYALTDPSDVAPVPFAARPLNATVVRPQDTARMVRLAKSGSPQAEYQLGRAYAAGRGVALNDADAVTWYAKAAAQGDPAAQTSLGWAYYIGAGVPRNVGVARQWLVRAARQGDHDAAHRLALVKRALAPTDLAAAYHH